MPLNKCPFCPRTFSNRSVYSRHVVSCNQSASSSEESSLITEISNMSLDSEQFSESLHDSLHIAFTSTKSSLSDQNIEENFLNDENYGDQNMLISESDQSNLISEISETSFNEDISEDILEEFDLEVKANYLNEAYADLMTLVTKYKLSNATGNAIIKFFNKHANYNTSPLPKSIELGRKFMDNMNLPNLSFDKTCIITYNNEEYYLHHCSLIDCITNILSISDITQNFALTFEKLEIDGERAYSEQNTGVWWKNVEDSLLPGSKLLSIILYSDATNVDMLGKKNLHPIYMSIGNIKNWRRNKPDAKQLLGFLPILKSGSNAEKQSENFKNASREAFHKSLEVLLEPILTLKNGIELTFDDNLIWFYPRISIVIADWPEAATYCLTYKSPMSKFPCHFCLTTKDNLANIDLQASEMELRMNDNMRQKFDENLARSVCIENLPNIFWKFP